MFEASSEPASVMEFGTSNVLLGASSELASVMEFGFKSTCHSHVSSVPTRLAVAEGPRDALYQLQSC